MIKLYLENNHLLANDRLQKNIKGGYVIMTKNKNQFTLAETKGNESVVVPSDLSSHDFAFLVDIQGLKNDIELKEIEKVSLEEAKNQLRYLHPRAKKSYFERINNADFDEVDTMLNGCDYALFANIESIKEFQQQLN